MRPPRRKWYAIQPGWNLIREGKGWMYLFRAEAVRPDGRRCSRAFWVTPLAWRTMAPAAKQALTDLVRRDVQAVAGLPL